jgi:hypothetical protein
MAIAAIASVVLLLTFERVVRQAVQQAELRQVSAREKSNAVWRCNALTSRSARSACIQGLR